MAWNEPGDKNKNPWGNQKGNKILRKNRKIKNLKIFDHDKFSFVAIHQIL